MLWRCRYRRRGKTSGAWNVALLLGTLLAAVGWLPAAGRVAHAQSRPVPVTTTESDYQPAAIDGRKLFDLSSDGRLTARERASRVTRRLQNLIEREEPVPSFRPDDVQVRARQTLVLLGGEPIVAVTESDSQDHLSTAQDLAERWGERMAEAVADARAVRTNPLRGASILIRNSAQDLFLSVMAWLPRLAGALFLVVLFWFLARLAAAATRLLSGRTQMDANPQQLARAVGFYGTWAVGAVAIFTVTPSKLAATGPAVVP